MIVSQADFTRAVLDPEMSVPEGLITPQGQLATERFNVYRNNVAISLTEALRVTFPLLVKSLGEEFFNAMAGAFVRTCPPESPILMFYGEQMPGFLESFKPVQQYPYLPDIARLELALVQSYHATDSTCIDPVALVTASAQELMKCVLCLAPSVRLIRSSWPLYQLWRFNTELDAPKPLPAAEDVLVIRPEFDPVLRCLPEGGGAFVADVLSGRNLEVALSHFKDENVTQSLAILFGIFTEGNAITSIK